MGRYILPYLSYAQIIKGFEIGVENKIHTYGL